MSGPNGETCGLCHYFTDPQALEALRGWCHVSPPPYAADLVVGGPQPDPVQPMVSASYWCSHFKVHPRILNKLTRSGVVDWETDFDVKVIE